MYVKKEIREFIEKMPKKEKLTREWKKFIQESTIKHNLLIEHGKEEYERAEKLAQSLFNNKFEDLTKQDIADLFDEQDMKEVNVDISIVDIVISVGAASSKREAREFITSGAVSLNGNKITDINVTVEGTITESKDGKSIATSQLNINLVSTKEGAISKLDGLFFKVTAIPGQATDVQLLSSQWMQLKDMKLKIPNGIKVDLN